MSDQVEYYIKENYESVRKIVEVGVGHRIDIAIGVKMLLPNVEVIVTDKDESWVRTRRTPRVQAVADDVMFPSLPVYEGAGLIYSLRPPLEMVPALERLAERVGADLLVVPISDEQEAFHRGSWRKVIRNGRTVGWLLPKH